MKQQFKIKYILTFFLALIFVLISCPLFSAEIQLSIDKSIVYLTGEQIKLIYTINTEPDEELIINESDTNLDSKLFYKRILYSPIIEGNYDIESLKNSIYTTKQKEANGKKLIEHNFQYNFQLFEINNLMISPIKFTFKKNNKSLIAYSPSTYIHFIPPKTKKNKLLSFKDIVEPTLEKNNLFNSIAILSITGSFAFIMFISIFSNRLLKWYYINNDKLGTPFSQVYSYFSMVKEELNNNITQKPSIKDIYTDLSYNMKLYLERKYVFSSVKMCSEEIIRFLSFHIDDQNILSKVKTFFYICDSIKFAYRSRNLAEIQNDIKLATNIICILNKRLKA